MAHQLRHRLPSAACYQPKAEPRSADPRHHHLRQGAPTQIEPGSWLHSEQQGALSRPRRMLTALKALRHPSSPAPFQPDPVTTRTAGFSTRARRQRTQQALGTVLPLSVPSLRVCDPSAATFLPRQAMPTGRKRFRMPFLSSITPPSSLQTLARQPRWVIIAAS